MQLDGLLARRDVDAGVGVGQPLVGRAPFVGRHARSMVPDTCRVRFSTSSACFVSCSGTGTGYSPVKHAVQNDSRGEPVAATSALEIEVRERVDTEVVGDLADRHVGREQVGALAGVEPVEARPAVRRRRHAEVHLGRAGFAQQRDDLARRGAADDRVVDDDEPLALDVVARAG